MMKALLALLLMVPAAACDDTPAAAAPVFDDVLVTVSGTVKFDGPPPPVKANKAMTADPLCAALHAVPPPQENLVVHPDGGVAWAFVWIKSGLAGREFAPPKEGVTIDQKGCTYAPHVAGAQVGQAVIFRNSDPLLHNVHPMPFVNKEFNVGQLQGAVYSTKFASAEVPIRIACNVHPWMSAYVCVVEHPYWAVTDAEGKFEIKNLPAGKYVLGLWHEGLKAKDGKDEVEIVVKENKAVDFTVVRK